jgi:hypothetical protein
MDLDSHARAKACSWQWFRLLCRSCRSSILFVLWFVLLHVEAGLALNSHRIKRLSFSNAYCVLMIIFRLETYPMHMDSSCAYHTYELTKFTKKSEKITYIFSIIPHLYIEFQHQIPNNKGAVKRQNLWQIYSKKILFLLQINYNGFNLEILYTGSRMQRTCVIFFRFFMNFVSSCAQ